MKDDIIRSEREKRHALGLDPFEVYDEAVQLGGIRQSVQFWVGNPDADMLLVIHGGPGCSELAISYGYDSRITDKYLVVNWDQRCVGQTALLSGASSEVPLSFETIVSDGVELAEYLKKKYPGKKLFIMGHSWGSALGAVISSRHPELVDGYIGWGQVVNFVEEETEAFEHTIEYVNEKGDSELISQIEALKPYPVDDEGNVLISKKLVYFTAIKYACGYGAVKYPNLQAFNEENIAMAVRNPFFKQEALQWMNNEIPYIDVFNEFNSMDIGALAPEFKMPVCIIYGDNDWQTPYTTGQAYLEKLIAPKKEFFFVKNAGHSTTFDNEDDFVELLRGPVFELMNS